VGTEHAAAGRERCHGNARGEQRGRRERPGGGSRSASHRASLARAGSWRPANGGRDPPGFEQNHPFRDPMVNFRGAVLPHPTRRGWPPTTNQPARPCSVSTPGTWFLKGARCSS
jgi:hypothetical protein